MKTLALTLAVMSIAGYAVGSRTDYLNVKRKFQTLDSKPPKPGTRISITSVELKWRLGSRISSRADRGVQLLPRRQQSRLSSYKYRAGNGIRRRNTQQTRRDRKQNIALFAIFRGASKSQSYPRQIGESGESRQ